MAHISRLEGIQDLRVGDVIEADTLYSWPGIPALFVLDNVTPVIGSATGEWCVWPLGNNGLDVNTSWIGRGINASYSPILPIEAWVARGVPVTCSVSYDLLKGKGKKSPNDGHLLVVGFTPEGDLVLNDPGRKPIRLVYPRADFEAAWATSDHTVYLIHPVTWSVPKSLGGAWPGAAR